MSFYPTIVDVSHHNGNIDWDTARNYIHFAIVRVQDGKSTLDRKLSRNVAACERLGIPYYLYGYYRNGGATEAQLMLSRAKSAGAKSVLGYVCDLEEKGYSKSGVKAFMGALPKDLKNGLYIAHHLYSSYGTGYGEDWVWIPRYGANTGKPILQPAYACDLWQFTSNGTVPGIGGVVDCNACTGKDVEWFTGKDVSDVTEADIEKIAQAVWTYAIGTDATLHKDNQEAWKVLSWIHHDSAACYLAATDTSDPTGREQEMTTHDHVKWLALVVQQTLGAVKKIAEHEGIDLSDVLDVESD